MVRSYVPKGERRGTVQVTVPAEEEYVGVVRMVVGGAASTVGLADEDVADLKLAVSEACTNAVHAYDVLPSHPHRTVEVNLSLWEGVVEVDIRDRGSGTKSRLPTSMPRTEGEEGGFGLTLIGCLMDVVELIDDTDSSTRLRFLKRSAAA